MSKHSLSELQQLQALSLNEKVERTKARIRQWVEHYGLDHVYISFSGGKDSTVLLHIARSMYPNIKAVFCDTSLEFPELREFVLSFDNVEVLKPPMNFRQVIEKYGYPVISKEVSECAYGARIYLTKLMEENSIVQTDRQTDNNIPYAQFYRKICGLGEYSKPITKTGGVLQKSSRLGCYSNPHGTERTGERRISPATSKDDRESDKGRTDKGEYP